MTLEPSILNRLIYGRELYELARRLRNAGTRTGMAEGLVILDASVETILPAALATKNVTLGEKAGFGSTVAAVVRNFNFPLEKASAWDRLHHARNEIQHSGIIPDPTQIQQLGADAIASLKELLTTGLGVELARISVAELFVDPVVKGLYVKAEEAEREGRIQDAAIGLVACFERARLAEQGRMTGSLITFDLVASKNPDGGPSPHRHSNLGNYVEKLHGEVEVLKLGLDYKAYRKYVDGTAGKVSPAYPGVLVAGDDAEALFASWTYHLKPGPTDSEEWVQFAFRFVRDSVMRWQELNRMGIWEVLSEAIEEFGRTWKPRAPERP